jgi:hypothetical protein
MLFKKISQIIGILPFDMAFIRSRMNSDALNSQSDKSAGKIHDRRKIPASGIPQ